VNVRSPLALRGLAIRDARHLLREDEGRRSERRSPRERRKNGRKVGGGRECVYSAASFPPLPDSPSASSPSLRFASLPFWNKLELSIRRSRTFSSHGYIIGLYRLNCIAVRYICLRSSLHSSRVGSSTSILDFPFSRGALTPLRASR